MLSILGSSAFGLIIFLAPVTSNAPVEAPTVGEIITWAIIGLFAGVIAKVIMPGKDPGGCLVTIVLGMLGVVIGGFLAHYVLHIGSTGYFSGGFFARLGLGIVGAMIILAIYRLIAGRRA
jgi:uncharacterized membrane protein YeaQ/YmgE (transglycosylase-associated protein family)